MGRPKGIPKTGGRKRGTPNQTTLLFRDALASNGLDLAAEIVRLLPMALPEKQIDVLVQLLPYAYPKLKNIEESVTVDVPKDRTRCMTEEEVNEELRKLFLNEANRCSDPDLAAAHKKAGQRTASG
jgi:hypothetical protein